MWLTMREPRNTVVVSRTFHRKYRSIIYNCITYTLHSPISKGINFIACLATDTHFHALAELLHMDPNTVVHCPHVCSCVS